MVQVVLMLSVLQLRGTAVWGMVLLHASTTATAAATAAATVSSGDVAELPV